MFWILFTWYLKFEIVFSWTKFIKWFLSFSNVPWDLWKVCPHYFIFQNLKTIICLSMIIQGELETKNIFLCLAFLNSDIIWVYMLLFYSSLRLYHRDCRKWFCCPYFVPGVCPATGFTGSVPVKKYVFR